MARYKVVYSLKRVDGELLADDLGTAIQRARRICDFYNKKVNDENKKDGWIMEIASISLIQGQKICV